VQAAGAAPILDGGFLAAGNCTVDWASTLDIIGSFDAGGFAVTHSNIGAVGINQITCDIADKNLDLGSTHADLKKIVILIQAATTATSTVTAKIWQMTGGSYNDGGQAHNIDGDILDSGGTLVSTGTWTMTGTGNIAGGTFQKLVLAASTKTTSMTANTICKELELGAGTLDGAFILQVNISADNKIVQHADNTIDATQVTIQLLASPLNIAALDTSGGSTKLLLQGNDRTAVMTGDLDCGTNEVRVNSSANATVGRLDLATNSRGFTAGDVVVGISAALDRGGRLDLGPTSTITGAITGGDATNKAANVITMPAGSTHTWSGSINGTNIDTITAGAGVVIRGGGTITACDGDPGNIVRCLGMVDGGGNHANYVFSSARGARQTLIGVG